MAQLHEIDIIPSNEESDKLYITKIAAADRQLNASIRLYFLQDEPLAIHTVASAAFNVFGDILQRRGRSPSIHTLIVGIFHLARKHLDGRVSFNDLERMGVTVESLEPFLQFLRNNPDATDDDIVVKPPPELERLFWRKQRKAYNFLKHAEFDRHALLDAAAINNEDLIFRAIDASLSLNCELSLEKQFFFCAMTVIGKLSDGGLGAFEDADDCFRPLIDFLKVYSREEVYMLGRAFLVYPSNTDPWTLDVEFFRSDDERSRAWDTYANELRKAE